MTLDFLIKRHAVMAILDIKCPNKFRELVNEGYIPPAWGQSKRSHLWSNKMIQDLNKAVINNGNKFCKQLTLDVSLNALIRLMDQA